MKRKIILFIALCFGFQITAQPYTKEDVEKLRTIVGVTSFASLPAAYFCGKKINALIPRLQALAQRREFDDSWHTRYQFANGLDELKNQQLILIGGFLPLIIDEILAAALEENQQHGLVRLSKFFSELILINQLDAKPTSFIFAIIFQEIIRPIIFNAIKKSYPNKDKGFTRRLLYTLTLAINKGIDRVIMAPDQTSKGAVFLEDTFKGFLTFAFIEYIGSIIACNMEEKSPQQSNNVDTAVEAAKA